MNYKILASCSSGNAVIIRDIILIDCGVTFKRLQKYYKKFKKYNNLFYIAYPLHLIILFELYKTLFFV